MSKLPKIFHTDNKYITNNKNTFNAFEKKVEEKPSIKNNLDEIVNYFNRRVVINLKNGNILTGILIAKRNNKILLDTSDYILIDDILDIK